MKNSSEKEKKIKEKKRFMSLYYGTKTLYVGGVDLQEVGNGGWNLNHPDFFLELKSLSNITEEDAINLAKVCWYKYPAAWNIQNGKKTVESLIDPNEFDFYDSWHTQVAIDFLRSKGYALPYMLYSIEDLISFKWMRLV